MSNIDFNTGMEREGHQSPPPEDSEVMFPGLPQARRETPTSPRSYVEELADLGLELGPDNPRTSHEGAEVTAGQQQSDLPRYPDRPTEAHGQEFCTPPPTYRASQEMPWVAQGRGGGGFEGFSADHQDFTRWLRLGAGGRPVGAATQVMDAGRSSPERRVLFTLSPQHTTCPQGQREATQQGLQTESDGTLQQVLTMIGDLNLQMRDLDGRLSAEMAMRLDASARLLRVEEKAARAELEAQQEGARRQALEEDLARESRARQELAARLATEGADRAHLEVQCQALQEELVEVRQGQGQRLASLEHRIEASDHQVDDLERACRTGLDSIQEMLGSLTLPTTLLPPMAASTPRGTEGDSGCPGTQESSSSAWSYEATAGTPTSDRTPRPTTHLDKSPQQPGKSVHFQDPSEEHHLDSPRFPPPVPVPGDKQNRAVPNLASFSGKPGDNLQYFLAKMDDAREYGNWTKGHLRNATKLQLQGAARDYINSLPAESVATLAGLHQALRAKYEGKLAQDDAKAQLRQLVRRSNETPEALARRIQSLTRIAFADKATQEAEGIVIFRDALSDASVAQQFIAIEPKTVDQCATVLTRMERDRDQRNRLRTARIRHIQEEPVEPPQGSKPKGPPAPKAPAKVASVTTSEKTATEQKLDQVLREVGQMSRRLGDIERREHFERHAMDHSCSLCNSPTHWEESCPRRRENQGRGTGGPRQGPSNEMPCNICGSPTHWANRCPQRRNTTRQGRGAPQGNGQGLDPGSKGQSNN